MPLLKAKKGVAGGRLESILFPKTDRKASTPVICCTVLHWFQQSNEDDISLVADRSIWCNAGNRIRL